MRVAQPTDHGSLTKEIEKLEREAASLDAEASRVDGELTDALAATGHAYSESRARSLRSDLAALRERRALHAGRIDALRGKLPTAKERKAAHAEVAELTAASEAAAARVRASGEAYVRSLEAAEQAARDLLAARAEARSCVNRLEDLGARHGIDVGRPSVPALAEAKLANLLGTYAAQAAFGPPDSTVVQYIESVRRKQAC